jgi:thiamine phosphate synthase YjbQ (UPF0047 family)
VKTIELSITTGRRRGLFDLTAECERFVAGEGDGLLNVFEGRSETMRVGRAYPVGSR